MSFFFNTYPSEEIFVLFWILTPSSETRRAVGSLGLCSHPHFIHLSPHKTVFVGFLCCFRVVTFVVVCGWIRETPKEVLYFLISNTKVQSQRTMVVGSLGVSPHPHFIYLAPPKNCLVVFVLLLLVLLAGHKNLSQSWTRKNRQMSFFPPPSKPSDFKLKQRLNKLFHGVSTSSFCSYLRPQKLLLLFLSCPHFIDISPPETDFIHFVLSSLHATPPTKVYFVVLVLLLFSSAFSLLLLLWMVSKYAVALGRKKPRKL